MQNGSALHFLSWICTEQQNERFCSVSIKKRYFKNTIIGEKSDVFDAVNVKEKFNT